MASAVERTPLTKTETVTLEKSDTGSIDTVIAGSDEGTGGAIIVIVVLAGLTLWLLSETISTASAL
jgi:hypothetical protein